MTQQLSHAFRGDAARKSSIVKALRSLFDGGAQHFEPGTVAWNPSLPSGTITGLTAMADGAEHYEDATGIPAAVGLTHETLFCSAQLMSHDGAADTQIETPEWLLPHLTGWLDSIEPGWNLQRALQLFQRHCADLLLQGWNPDIALGDTARAIVLRWRALLSASIENETQAVAAWVALRQRCSQAVGLPPFDQAVVTLVDTVAWPDDDAGDEWLRGWGMFVLDAPRAGLEADLDPELAALHVASEAAWRELHVRAEREPGFDPYMEADAQPAIAAVQDPQVTRRLNEAAVRRARPMVEALFKVFVASLQDAQALAPQVNRATPVSTGGRGLIDLPVGQFDAEVLQAPGLVLVDFWAVWCAPCKQFMPTLGALERQFGDRVKFVKVDVDQHEVLANKLGIRALPTLMLYRDGEPVERVNVLTRARIEALLQAQLA